MVANFLQWKTMQNSGTPMTINQTNIISQKGGEIYHKSCLFYHFPPHTFQVFGRIFQPPNFSKIPPCCHLLILHPKSSTENGAQSALTGLPTAQHGTSLAVAEGGGWFIFGGDQGSKITSSLVFQSYLPRFC